VVSSRPSVIRAWHRCAISKAGWKLLFEFSNGELVNVSLKQSSGHPLLDQSALDTARKLQLPGLTGALARRSFSFTLPVEYRLQ
jgi:protein TonB